MSLSTLRVNRKFSDQEFQDIQAAFSLVETTFDFYRGTPPAQQGSLLRMGTQNRKFVQQIKNAVEDLNWLLPAYIPLPTYQDEYELFYQLETLEAYIKSLLAKVQQTQLVAGHHLVRDSLDIYSHMQNAHNRGMVEVAPYLATSEERFDYPSSRSSAETEDAGEGSGSSGNGDASGNDAGGSSDSGGAGNGDAGGDDSGGSGAGGNGGSGDDGSGGSGGSGGSDTGNGTLSNGNDKDPGATDGSGGGGSDPMVE